MAASAEGVRRRAGYCCGPGDDPAAPAGIDRDHAGAVIVIIGTTKNREPSSKL